MRRETIAVCWLWAAAAAFVGVVAEPGAFREGLGRLDLPVDPVLDRDAALDIRRDEGEIITPPPGAPQPSQTPVLFLQNRNDELLPRPTQPPVFDRRQLDNPQEAINAASRSAQQSIASMSQSAAEAVRQAQESVRRAEESARQAVAQATRDATEAARQARESANQAIGQASRSADERVRQADQSARQAAQDARESARQEVDRSLSLVQAARADATAVRQEASLQVSDAQGSALTTTQIALAVTASVAGGSILSMIIFWLVVRHRRAKAREVENQAAAAAAGAGAGAYSKEARDSFAASSVYSRQTDWKQARSVHGELESWLRQTKNDTSVYGGGKGRTEGSVSGATVRSTNWPFRQSRGPSRQQY